MLEVYIDPRTFTTKINGISLFLLRVLDLITLASALAAELLAAASPRP
jgi:hypothetical protein